MAGSSFSYRIGCRALAWSVCALAAVAGCYLCSVAVAADRSARFMIEATVAGRRIEGVPLTWSEDRVWLLGRDGRVWDFPPQEATQFRKTAQHFAPYSEREIAAALHAELGLRFEAAATQHYLICYPPGLAEDWGERFEQMFREFEIYFTSRGLKLHRPEVPMVAIVFNRRNDFIHYSMGEGFQIGAEVSGYYSPRTNRVAMYAAAIATPAHGDWRQNAAMLLHEAAHQAAFNTGLHSRLSTPPQWLAEGLATLFEARGIWNSETYRELSDRVNRNRLGDFRRFADAHRSAEWIQALVTSDRPFTQDVVLAYAQSWALTFYLNETQPAAYNRYLRTTAARSPFLRPTATDRVADFSKCFGDDWRSLDAHVRRFTAELR
jgi:Protein of unknown function (DUF1570)